jgi:hypothetical protein
LEDQGKGIPFQKIQDVDMLGDVLQMKLEISPEGYREQAFSHRSK